MRTFTHWSVFFLWSSGVGSLPLVDDARSTAHQPAPPKRTLALAVRHEWGGRRVIPIVDRGSAATPWLAACLILKQRFISRPGKGHTPWYLVTNQPVEGDEAAWRVVFQYSRRWQLEMSWRYLKSELGLECPRGRSAEVREKLRLVAALAYGFLLTLLSPAQEGVRLRLLAKRCSRTGRRAAETACPLYRLRLALSRLWMEHPPQFALLGQRAIRAGPGR